MQDTRNVDQFPRTADEVDLDRVIWDPAYRLASMQVLAQEPTKTTDSIN